MLDTRFEPGPTSWTGRIDPTKSSLLMNATDGSPRILLSKSAYLLHRALNGGWHWKKDNSGNIIGNLPVKDKHSHPGDAFCGLVSVLFPYVRLKTNKKKGDMTTRKRMARSYRGGNYSRPRSVAV